VLKRKPCLSEVPDKCYYRANGYHFIKNRAIIMKNQGKNQIVPEVSNNASQKGISC